MILDTLVNHRLYHGTSPRLAAGFEFLSRTDLIDLVPGRVDIDGDNVYAMVGHYHTKPAAEGLWEAHRKHIDIQYVLDVAERMGYANVHQMHVSKPYVEGEDYALFAGEGTFFLIRAGSFAVFTPEDVHMPNVAIDAPAPVKKIVVKVRV